MNKGVLVFAIGITATAAQPAGVPDLLQPPKSETVVLKAYGKGRQIYGCKAAPDRPNVFTWTLLGPEADLFGERGTRSGDTTQVQRGKLPMAARSLDRYWGSFRCQLKTQYRGFY